MQSSTSSAEQYAPDETTIAKSLPNKISWRHITTGESQKRSMDIATSKKEQYGLDYVNSHLIKNSEWGAVAYLCYSQYGNIPKINGTGSFVSGSYWYDLYTGQGPKTETDEKYYSRIDNSHDYSTTNGTLASTTGNITGIYDMNGGSWERVAGYLDNGNNNLNNYGKSADGSIKYFENGKLNPNYEKLWNKYEVSEEERTNKIALKGGTILTQDELWDWNKREEKYQEARLKITEAVYNKMKKQKGIGVNEIGTTFSFYAPYGDGTKGQTWGWFRTVAQAVLGTQGYGTTWDNDLVLIGHSNCPFVVRGGYCNNGSLSGVLHVSITNGYGGSNGGFRSVLVS